MDEPGTRGVENVSRYDREKSGLVAVRSCPAFISRSHRETLLVRPNGGHKRFVHRFKPFRAIAPLPGKPTRKLLATDIGCRPVGRRLAERDACSALCGTLLVLPHSHHTFQAFPAALDTTTFSSGVRIRVRVCFQLGTCGDRGVRQVILLT
jgi:hypothetical protein